MAMEIQHPFDLSSIPMPLELDTALSGVILSGSQLFQRSEPIQTQVEIQSSAPVVSTTYPESAHQWLVGVLYELIDFGQRHGHYGVIELTEDEYQWLDDVLEELICSVGENENHPLAPLMDFIIRLIANYEQAYVPKLTERFPELAEEGTTEAASENKQRGANTSKPSDKELAARAFFCIGFLLYHGNRMEEAISAYDTAIVLKPDFWEASYNCGIARYDSKQYAEAMFNFNKAIEVNHNFASAYHNRGILKSELKDYEGAITDFNEAIILKPDHIEAYNKRGIAKSQLDRHESAIADFDRVLSLNPNHADAYYNRGLENNQLCNYQTAIVDFDKVIKLDPNDIAAYNNRGVAKNYLHDYQSAIADFDKVIELDPSKALAYYNNGVVKNQIANYQSAITDFDKAIELGFNSVEVYYHRASSKVHLDEHNAALSDYDKVIELKPDFVEAYNIRGILRSELGRHDEALADYTEAIRIKPDYAEAYAYRGVLKAHLGRINKARSDFQKALELAKCSSNNNLKAFVENQLQQLNQEASKQKNKEPRRGEQMQTHIVTRVIDGDTLEVSPEISRRAALQTPMERLIGTPLPAETPTERLSRPHTFHKIRLKNIDAPEIGTPQGEKAIRYLKQLLEGKRVTFKPAGISYDRVVADVWRYPDHVFVNAIMVYSGHAKWSHPPR